MRARSNARCKNGINWYYEQEGSGPHVVLIPDGVGDCQLFDKPISLMANQGFTLTTFDMPGMSRSSEAPIESYQNVTAQKLAKYVVGILDELQIETATFWGCSSGGSTVLALADSYPERTRNILPHEVPTYSMDKFSTIANNMDDGAVADIIQNHMRARNHTNLEAWDALGEEVHARLAKNYPRWARGYSLTLPRSSPTGKEALAKRPVDWTVGESTPMGRFMDNVVTATKNGISISTLPGAHFPYVSDPEVFAKHVVQYARKYL